ncbi:MAG: LicD family protein [Prevotellaceae bacterium]|nr:LicD family protein [Prevotellaceae bacterium]MDY3856355.1 LicD family protein [Bacteroidaceae bacterium]
MQDLDQKLMSAQRGSYDIRQLQLRLLDILVAIDEMCHKQGLRYYLMYGSMLGAVRHSGFIPWDDDIDIGLPRPDYERLIRHWREWLPDHLELVCPENDPTYPVAFGKIQDARTTLIERPHYPYLGGIYCDIYPLDGAPSAKWRRRLHIAHYFVCFRALYLIHRDPYRHGHGPSSWVPLLLRKVTTLQHIQQTIRRILLKYPYEDCDLICLYNDHTHAVIPKEVFGQPQPISFEGKRVNGVADARAYLLKCFGDTYMQQPPKNKRHQHHYYYLDFDHPYREYKAENSK